LARSGRRCGSCSLCCRLLDVPEISKPKDDWCQHCRPGKGGCSIYDQRPQICRAYACGWLLGHLQDDWFPPKAKMIVDVHYDKKAVAYFVRIIVDPRCPNRWREQPYYSDIKQITLRALQGKIVPDMMVQTVIAISGKWTKIVMPHREIDYSPGVVLPFGDDHFEFVPCKNDEAVRVLDKKLTALRQAKKDFPNASIPELLEIASIPELLEIAARKFMHNEGRD